MAGLLVKDLVQRPEFRDRYKLLAGENGLENEIQVPYLQRPGLAMTGYTEFLLHHQIHVFGRTEINYLRHLEPRWRDDVLGLYFDFGLACVIISRNLKVPPEFLANAERTNTPVLRTSLLTHVIIERLTKFLEVRFSNSLSIHGVLVDVHGVGILLLGRGGIGKSECALDLLLKGHRLVADDMVVLVRIPPGIIRGETTDVIKYHMEIRGLGVINVKELFGISSIRDQKKIHLVVKLVDWDEAEEYDRIGLEENYYNLLNVDLPMIVLPVAPGRNISAIIEVAAKNHLLKLEGFHAAQEFQKHLLERLDDLSEHDELEEPE